MSFNIDDLQNRLNALSINEQPPQVPHPPTPIPVARVSDVIQSNINKEDPHRLRQVKKIHAIRRAFPTPQLLQEIISRDLSNFSLS